MGFSKRSQQKTSTATKSSWYQILVVTTCIIILLDFNIKLVQANRGHEFSAGRACKEIYVVREGETLNMIAEKCGDQFILERNPHIHDPDDVFPGLVISITTSSSYDNLRPLWSTTRKLMMY